MRIRYFSRHLLILVLSLLSLTLSACHIKPDNSYPEASIPPAIKPTIEAEYLLAQNQIPSALRTHDDTVVQKTRDINGKTRLLIYSTPTTVASQSSTTSSYPIPRAGKEVHDMDYILSTNPPTCTQAALNTPFKGTYAAQSWSTPHDTLYSLIVTSHAIDLDWLKNYLQSCAHFQVHRFSSVQTLDRTFHLTTINKHPTLVENTVITSSSTTDGKNPEIGISFTRRFITTLPEQKVSLQLQSSLDHPFTTADNDDLITIFSRQIDNIPVK